MAPDPDDLLDHVCTHLCDEQPEAVADLPDSEIRRRAALAVARAQSHGFTEPEPITAYATLMFLVAPDFDEHPAIARALAAKAPEPDRLKRLFSSTQESDWDAAAAASRGWDSLE
jgi:hypothetical protein